MAKRMQVKYRGAGQYSALEVLAIGTEFKAVEFKLTSNLDMKCVYIRGSSLAKATGNKAAFPHKQYVFALGFDNSDFEDITNAI